MLVPEISIECRYRVDKANVNTINHFTFPFIIACYFVVPMEIRYIDLVSFDFKLNFAINFYYINSNKIPEYLIGIPFIIYVKDYLYFVKNLLKFLFFNIHRFPI